MKITTKHQGLKRDLERLIKQPKHGIVVKLVGSNKDECVYDVQCGNMLDLIHECKQLNSNTATTTLG